MFKCKECQKLKDQIRDLEHFASLQRVEHNYELAKAAGEATTILKRQKLEVESQFNKFKADLYASEKNYAAAKAEEHSMELSVLLNRVIDALGKNPTTVYPPSCGK